jgi:protoheme IX farnesyltransferase
MRDYLALTKPRITWLILMSTAVGYAFGLPAHGWMECLRRIADWRTLHTLLGAGLMASGTAALNEWYERDADARMRRTAARPIPAGKITPTAALCFGVAISLIGFLELAFGANWQAAALGAGTLVSYLGIYTPLKKRSPVCTTVGAVPGALPPAIGYAAAHGTLTLDGIALAFVLFLWQFPHFYAIAWMYREDYARGGIRMLPVVHPDCRSTARRMVLFSAALIASSLLPWALGMSGWRYGVLAVALGCWPLWKSVVAAAERTPARAREVLLASVAYLPALYVCMLADRTW